MAGPDPELAAKLQPDVPHAARIWNYWMGGKDNFQSDRAAGDAVAEVYPEIVL
ncbi:SAM-dependent methyltransferase, partial [Micromonospora sp. M51]